MLTTSPGHTVDGNVSIIPANTHFPPPHETGNVVAAALHPSFVTCSTASLGGGHAELRDVRGVTDALIVQLVTALRSEAGIGPFAEALATALAMHLVSHYSVNRSAVCEADRGLGGTRLRAVVDYIDRHLGRNLSIETLAQAAGLSPSHFIRMFQYSTGLSPHQYVLRARVLRAQELLRRTRHSLAEIAQMTGFCGQSHFTKHFGRVLGVTPRRYRRNAGAK
jgi:AraC family transcriptional regulator